MHCKENKFKSLGGEHKLLELSPYSVMEFVDDENVDMTINTINAKGYMGKGLAKEYATWFPEMKKRYSKMVRLKKITAGKLWVWDEGKQLIGNMVTKDDYKFPSKMEWISNSLSMLREYVEKKGIKTVAIPKIGASLGKLDWEKVESKIVNILYETEVKWIICLDVKVGPKEEKALENIFTALKEGGISGQERMLENIPYEAPSTISKELLKTLKLVEENKTKIKRFRDLRKIKGLGDVKYENLLKEFWRN